MNVTQTVVIVAGIGSGGGGPVVRQYWLSSKPAGVVAAYSLYRLWPEHAGDLLVVRRASDNTTQSIGSEGIGFDYDAITAFCGENDGFVSEWSDQSGLGRDAAQATTSKQPRILHDGRLESSFGLPGIRFGVNGTVKLVIPSALLDVADGGFTVLCRYSILGTASFQTVLSNAATLGNPWVSHGAGYAVRGAISYANATITVVANATDLHGESLRVDRYEQANSLAIRVNGVDSVSEPTNDLDITIPTSYEIGNGGIDDVTQMIGHLDTLILFNLALSPADITELESDADSLTLSTMTAIDTVTPTAFTDSITNVDAGTHIAANPFSRLIIETTATEIEVDSYTNYFVAYPFLTRIGVRVNGVDTDPIKPTANGVNTDRLFFSPGIKTIELINGPQSVPSSIIGTWVKSVRANAAMTVQTPALVTPLLVYGDSISVGGNSDTVMRSAWVLGVRDEYSGNTILEGTGSRTLHDDAADSTLRAAFVSRIASVNPSIIWLAIGTNDYALSAWSAADFEAAYDSFLSDLHTVLPIATIYAQTPIVRTSNGANDFADTSTDYRTAISNAASGKPYVTVVDGTAIMTTGDLADGVHPTTAGHLLYSAYVKTVLGI